MVCLFLLVPNSFFLLSFAERDAFDTLLDHAPDKLNVVKTVRSHSGRDKNFCVMVLIIQNEPSMFVFSVADHICE